MSDQEPVYLALRRTSEVPNLEGYGVPAEAVRSFNLAMGQHIIGGAHGLWLEPDCGDGHNPDRLAFRIGSRLSALCDLFNGVSIRSPIEAQLAASLLWLDMAWAGFPSVDNTGLFECAALIDDGRSSCFLTPQASIEGYKADFLLWFQCGKARGGVVIECDGHEFHERTKDQAARDKRRDREILTAGFPVMRFTGSEIFKDPVSCLSQVQEAADKILHRVSKDGGLY